MKHIRLLVFIGILAVGAITWALMHPGQRKSPLASPTESPQVQTTDLTFEIPDGQLHDFVTTKPSRPTARPGLDEGIVLYHSPDCRFPACRAWRNK